MRNFIGRRAELRLLRKRLARVTDTGVGTAVALRRRRQVGKSRLVQEFCDRADAPYVYFTATKGASPVESVAEFLTELRHSELPADPELIPSDVAGGGVRSGDTGPRRVVGNPGGVACVATSTIFAL